MLRYINLKTVLSSDMLLLLLLFVWFRRFEINFQLIRFLSVFIRSHVVEMISLRISWMLIICFLFVTKLRLIHVTTVWCLCFCLSIWLHHFKFGCSFVCEMFSENHATWIGPRKKNQRFLLCVCVLI